jgi:hypothetical protein
VTKTDATKLVNDLLHYSDVVDNPDATQEDWDTFESFRTRVVGALSEPGVSGERSE